MMCMSLCLDMLFKEIKRRSKQPRHTFERRKPDNQSQNASTNRDWSVGTDRVTHNNIHLHSIGIQLSTTFLHLLANSNLKLPSLILLLVFLSVILLSSLLPPGKQF